MIDSFFNFMRDPLWGFVAVLIAIFYSRHKENWKALILIESSKSLVSISDEIKDRIEITVDGVPVKDVSMFTMSLLCSGNVPILANDFVKPLTFVFGGAESKLISASIARAVPDQFKPILKHSDSSVLIEPFLMNPGDSLTIQVLVSHFDGAVGLDYRIHGVSKIRRGKSPDITFVETKEPTRVWTQALSSAIVFVFGVVQVLSYFDAKTSWTGLFLGLGMTLLGAIFLAESYPTKKRK